MKNKNFNKFYSTSTKIPLIIYFNVKTEKSKILKDNKNKAGVYRWVNLINNKTYIGSSINLSSRFYKYFSNKHLTINNTPIYKAILKYGYSKFKLEILEYTEKENTISTEQFYIDNYKPEYNILRVAGSLAGFKHNSKTIEYFLNERVLSKEARGNLSKAATGRILSE